MILVIEVCWANETVSAIPLHGRDLNERPSLTLACVDRLMHDNSSNHSSARVRRFCYRGAVDR
jgi:hypothetical protein